VADNRQERIARLSQRFQTHAGGRPPGAERARERRSFYLATEVTQRLDQTHKSVDHDLFAQGGVSKSLFLETVIEYGLAHLDELKQILSEKSATQEKSEPS